MLHQATATLLFDNGTILGVSGFLRRLFETGSSTPFLFFTGMALSYASMLQFAPSTLPTYPIFKWTRNEMLSALGTGMLMGWGTKVCGGCTSGHMLCGLGHLSTRSFLATAIFFLTAMATFHRVNPSLDTAVCNANISCYKPVTPTYAVSSILASLVVVMPFLRAVFKAMASKFDISLSNAATYLTTGFTFGLGLLLSGLADPAKVQSFFALSLFPPSIEAWDPSLALVALFGIIPNIMNNRRHGFERPPSYADRFALPTMTMRDVDAKFILGAVVFGVSWGLSGVCPGPAVLRAIAQPRWGLLWLPGFWLGGLLG